MSTKAQVQRKADKTGCEFKVEGNLVTLYPPKGFAFEGEYEMLGRECDPGYLSKADIYDELFDAMDDLRNETKGKLCQPQS
jgi:hypothetical protein